MCRAPQREGDGEIVCVCVHLNLCQFAYARTICVCVFSLNSAARESRESAESAVRLFGLGFCVLQVGKNKDRQATSKQPDDI